MSQKKQNKNVVVITYIEENEAIETSIQTNGNLKVYSLITALSELSNSLKMKVAEYRVINNISPSDEDFEEIIKKITIQDLQK